MSTGSWAGTVLAGVLTGVLAGVLAGAVVVLAAGEVGAVAALLAVVGPWVWAGLDAVVVLPDGGWLAGFPARVRPSTVPPAASRKARVSTTGSRAVRRRGGLDPGPAGPVGPAAGPSGPVADGCQVWASTVWVAFSYRAVVLASRVLAS